MKSTMVGKSKLVVVYIYTPGHCKPSKRVFTKSIDTCLDIKSLLAMLLVAFEIVSSFFFHQMPLRLSVNFLDGPLSQIIDLIIAQQITHI